MSELTSIFQEVASGEGKIPSALKQRLREFFESNGAGDSVAIVRCTGGNQNIRNRMGQMEISDARDLKMLVIRPDDDADAMVNWLRESFEGTEPGRSVPNGPVAIVQRPVDEGEIRVVALVESSSTLASELVATSYGVTPLRVGTDPPGADAAQAWLFQSNPDYYELDRALRELPAIEWTVRGHVASVRSGDRAYIWRAGREAGIVAVGTVLTEPAESPPRSEERPYWRQPDRYGFDKVEPRIRVRIDRVVEPPLLRTKLLDDPVLSNLMVIRAPRGTLYEVPEEHELRLKELLADGPAETTGHPVVAVPVPGPLPPELEELHQQLRRKRQVILQGPPGVGKTFTARRYISWLAHGDPERARLTSHLGALPEDGRTVASLVDEVEASGLPVVWDIVQFHPSYTYEDFIRGLVARPIEQGITFEARDKIGGLMATVARTLRDRGSEARAVLVIDEINRGDISKIFGELIYGLEYRDQPVASPYAVDGSSEIVIPSNLSFIGTMNTADRSIALVDYALRRRFVFLDIQPDRQVIDAHSNFSGGKDRSAALWLFDQIGALFSEVGLQELQVGHSYFLLEESPPNGDAGCEALAGRFGYEIYPLLLEYEAEGRFERNQLDTLLIELGVAEAGLELRQRQREIAQLVATRLKSEPWRT